MQESAIRALPKNGPSGIQFAGAALATKRHVCLAGQPDISLVIEAAASCPGSSAESKSDVCVGLAAWWLWEPSRAMRVAEVAQYGPDVTLTWPKIVQDDPRCPQESPRMAKDEP
jgi:hypothetical protein